MCGFIMLGCPNSNKKKFIFITLITLFSKKNIKFKVALLRCAGPEADGHFGFKPWSPSREIRHAELDVLCIGGQDRLWAGSPVWPRTFQPRSLFVCSRRDHMI
jgi:hypothetical protein